MATFPKLFEALNPWSSKKGLFESSAEAPSSGVEMLPPWKELLNMEVEQAEMSAEDQTRLQAEIKAWKPTTTEHQDQFEARMKYQIERAEIIESARGKYGNLIAELATDNEPIVFLQQTTSDAKHLSNAAARAELVKDAVFKINFGVGQEGVNQAEAKISQSRIGLHHIFAKNPEVNKIAVTKPGGSQVELVRCADGKYRQEGQTTGRHYPVYQNYTIRVLEVSGDTPASASSKAEEVKREDTDRKEAETALTEAQKREAETARTESQSKLKADREAALIMAGVMSGEAPAPAPTEGVLDAEAEKAFNVETAKLKGDISAVIKEVFKSEGKESTMLSACDNALNNKKFIDITFKPQTAQGEMQEITLTVVDKKGVEHVYKGVSNTPIGENAFVKELLPSIGGKDPVKNYYWNREAFKDLFKKMSEDAEGTTPRPELGSPYDNGVIYGGVRPAGTSGEQDSSETYKPSEWDSRHARLSPNINPNDPRWQESGEYDVNQIQSLKHGEGATLPAAMHDWTIRDFERNKYTVDHMDQFWDSLEGLATQAGKTEMALLQPFLDGNKITYQEICRQVYGRTPQGVWERYSEAKATVMDQKGKPDDADSPLLKIDKLNNKKDEYYTYAELKALTTSYEDFFTNSYRLLEAARLLEKNNASFEQVDTSADTTEEKQAKAVIAGIFDPEDSAPIAKRTLWEVLSSEKGEFEASMDQTHRSYLMRGENVYESSISSSGAYAQLVGEFIKNGEVDYIGLTTRLNQMMKAGLLFFEKMNAKDRNKLTKSYAETWGCSEEEVNRRLSEAGSLARSIGVPYVQENKFTPQDIALIQLGMIPENKRTGAEESASVERERARKERAIEAERTAVEATARAGIESAVAEVTRSAGLSAQEIAQTEDALLSKTPIGMNEKGQFGLVFHDVGGPGGNMDLGVGYGKQVVDIPLGDKGRLSVSVGVGAAFIEDMQFTFYPSVGASVSASRAFGGQGQNTAALEAGVSVGPGHLGAGVMGTVKFKREDKETGTISERARVWYFKLGAGIAGGVGLGEAGASVRFVEATIGRDLNSVAKKKYLEIKKQLGQDAMTRDQAKDYAETKSIELKRPVSIQEAYLLKGEELFNRELNSYVEKTLAVYRAEIDAATEKMSPEEKVAYQKALELAIAEAYILERGTDAINELCAIQFGKIGVGVGVGVLGAVVPYFGIAIKGRRVVKYVKTGPDMDLVMEAKVREQLATEVPGATLGTPVYLGGDLAISESGERTIDNSIMKFEQMRSLDGINARLRTQGMELVPLAGDPKKVQLKVRDVDGFVNIYVDPTSKIQAFAEGGKACINLDWEDAFSILRADHYTPFTEGGGGVKNVDIFISDNPRKTPLDIKDRTGERLTWRQTDIYPDGSKKNTLGTVAHVDRNTTAEGTATYKSAEALVTGTSDGLGDLTDSTARDALQADIRAILGQVPEGTEARLSALNTVVAELIKKGGISYEKLTTDPVTTKAIIHGVNGSFDPDLNSGERTYLLQALLVQSRATLSGSPDALKKHILGWNTKALEAFCASHGVDPATARSIMEVYGSTLGDLGGKDPLSTSMGQGYAFNTLIGQGELGTLGRGINSQWETTLIGMQEVSEGNLSTMFKLSSAQAQAFMKAQLREYRYNGAENPTPMQMLRSPLGMQLLEQAGAVFGMEKGKALVDAMKAGSIDTSESYWTEYEKALKQLEDSKPYLSETGFTVIPHQHMVMGFLESCRNFTVATKETLETRDSGTVRAVTTTETVDGVAGVGFTDVSAAVVTEKKDPPPETPPEDGSKEDTGTGGTGDRREVGSGRPEVKPGQGSGSTAGAGNLQEE